MFFHWTRISLSLLLFYSHVLPGTKSGTVAEIKKPEETLASSQNNNLTETESRTFGFTCEDPGTLQCLKEAMAELLPALAVPRRVEIWPGLALMSGGFSLEPPINPHLLDNYLTKYIKSFLSSISLHVQAIDGQVGQELLKLGKSLSSYESPRETSGRKKMNMALGSALCGGVLMAVAMAAISAMAGKALLMSILALALTFLNKGHGGGHGGKTSYDVIHAPSSFNSEFPSRSWAAEYDAYQILKSRD